MKPEEMKQLAEYLEKTAELLAKGSVQEGNVVIGRLQGIAEGLKLRAVNF